MWLSIGLKLVLSISINTTKLRMLHSHSYSLMVTNKIFFGGVWVGLYCVASFALGCVFFKFLMLRDACHDKTLTLFVFDTLNCDRSQIEGGKIFDCHFRDILFS